MSSKKMYFSIKVVDLMIQNTYQDVCGIILKTQTRQVMLVCVKGDEMERDFKIRFQILQEYYLPSLILKGKKKHLLIST